jgi:ASCH domain
MKALSIKQPWAQLIIIGAKDVENRSQRTSFRGRFAVHVSLKPVSYEDLDIGAIPPGLREPAKRAWECNAFAGRVIGTVELVDCIRDSDSIWAIDDHWHWVLRDPRPYSKSRPAKGRLGLWEWSPSGGSR